MFEVYIFYGLAPARSSSSVKTLEEVVCNITAASLALFFIKLFAMSFHPGSYFFLSMAAAERGLANRGKFLESVGIKQINSSWFFSRHLTLRKFHLDRETDLDIGELQIKEYKLSKSSLDIRTGLTFQSRDTQQWSGLLSLRQAADPKILSIIIMVGIDSYFQPCLDNVDEATV